MTARVLCLDPGFEWFGWSVVELRLHGEVVICDMGLIRTEKSNKKLNVRDADDNFRRWRDISTQLELLRKDWCVRVVCMEAYSPVRSSSVAAKLGGVYGILSAVCEISKVPVLSISPQEVRRKLGATSKEAVAFAVKARFSDSTSAACIRRFEGQYKKVKANHTHAWDSLGVFIACEGSDLIRAYSGLPAIS